MKIPKYVVLLAVVSVLVTVGCATPDSDSTPPIVDEEGNTMTPEQMTTRLAEGGWIAEPENDKDGRVTRILVRHSDTSPPPQPSGFAPPPGAMVLDDSTEFRDEDGNVLTFGDFQKRMNEGGWMPEPKLDDAGNVIAVILRRGDGPVPVPPGDLPSFVAGAERWQGSQLPDFEFKTLEGRTITSKGASGRVTVMNFWFRGCKPCIMEIPELNELVEQFSGQNVDFFAFSQDPEAEAREAVSETHFTYEVVADSGVLHHELGVSAYPTHLVFDSEGSCVAAYQGYSPGIAKAIARDIQRIR